MGGCFCHNFKVKSTLCLNILSTRYYSYTKISLKMCLNYEHIGSYMSKYEFGLKSIVKIMKNGLKMRKWSKTGKKMRNQRNSELRTDVRS